MLLRQAESGEIIKGTEDGQSLVWNETTQEWEPGSGGGGGSVAPLTNTFYVDVDTAVAPESQTGSIAAPFSSVQAAVDAAEDVPLTDFVRRALILIAPSESYVEGSGDVFFHAAYNVQLTFQGLGGGIALNASQNLARVGAVTSADPVTQAPQVIFDSLYVDSVSIAQRASESQWALSFYNCNVAGTVTCFAVVFSRDTVFQGAVSPGVQTIDCVFGPPESPGPSVQQVNYGAQSVNGAALPAPVANMRIDATTLATLREQGADFSAGSPRLDSSMVLGRVALVGQTDNVGPVALFAADARAGLYEVDAYLEIINPSGTGEGDLKIGLEWTDDVATRNVESFGTPITGGGFDTLKQTIQIPDAAGVFISTTGAVDPTDLDYRLRVTARLIEYTDV